jgi:hypothetical protein
LEPEAQAVPAKHRLRLDEGDSAAPTRKQTGREQETKSVYGSELWTGHSSAEHRDLVAKQSVFHEESAPAANGVDQRRRHLRERRELPPDCGRSGRVVRLGWPVSRLKRSCEEDVMARCLVSVRALGALVVAVSLVPGLAHAAPQAGGSSDKAAAVKTTQFSVKSGSCREFLSLPDGLRGLVVAWTAGRYHALGRWVLDEASAVQVVSGVEQACKASPEASFRYQVVGQVKKLR